MGRKQAPFYRLVVVDSRERRDGAFIDNLGIYNPMPAEYQCEIDAGRAIQWLDQGAQMSETARALLREQGVLYRWHLSKQGMADDAIDSAVDEFRSRRETERSSRADKRAAAAVARHQDELSAAKKAKAQAEAAAHPAPPVEEPSAEEAQPEEASAEATADDAAADEGEAKKPADGE